MENTLPQLSQRLKILRTSYQLPVLETEWVCGISRSALNNWEKGCRIPSADGLYKIASSFGVSIDWLLGISQVPYTRDSIILAESIQKPDAEIPNILSSYSSGLNFDNALTKDYFDKSRRETYKLAARANILVYMLYIKGWHDFFGDQNVKVATVKQAFRLTLAENGLYSSLLTKHPSAFIR